MALNAYAQLIDRQTRILLTHEAGTRAVATATAYLRSLATYAQLAALYAALADEYDAARTGDTVAAANARHATKCVVERIAFRAFG